MTFLSLERAGCGGGVLPAHIHDYPHACVVIGGAMIDRCWARDGAPAVPGEILINPGGVAHEIEVGAEPLDCLIVEWNAHAAINSFDRTPLHRPAADLARLADHLSTDNPATRVMARREIVATVNRSIWRREADTPCWLRDARAALDAMQEPVSVAKLAGLAGVHRATLATKFQNAYGLAPEPYRMLVKLKRAADLMISGEPAVSAALGAGFADQAHFTRAWRRYLDGTPGRWAATRATIVQDQGVYAGV